ncbi:diacylglycerol kinase family protein [Solirubrobacter ginsenosidimutans]|uniref:Diacylglycerol kinase family protein n=1 Tax=Solirubrobacter ginsenosidimutans TaxID=490573 RepID=A0A9X3MZA9_9ACTN|nr:diacylglycerol kinase family protein [Solirubrobacter ginsenosidimutans]
MANRRSGRGLDPAWLASMLGGAEIFGLGELDRIASVDRIAVCGGDGTIAPVAERASSLGVPLAVIPGGTANDFARAHGIPLDPREAVALAASGETLRSLELARLSTGRPFVNVASAGLSSVAARRAAPLKSRFGPLAYGIGASRAALSGRPLDVTVRVDELMVFSGRAWQVIVASSGAFGGGSGIGAADATDGQVDVVVVPAGSRVALVRRAWGLRTQTIERQRAVPHFAGREVRVALPSGTELNVDGEFVDGGLDRVSASPAAFALVVPGSGA